MRIRFSFLRGSIVFAAVLGAGCGDDNSQVSPPGGTTFSIGGSISGLTADGLVLENNGGDDLTVAANATSFVFATAVSSGSPYAVTVLTQPADEVCTVTGGSGTVTANVQSVSVSCVPQQGSGSGGGGGSATAGVWTWQGGSDTAPGYGLPGIYGTLGSADPANIPGGREQSASWRDSAGNFWLFGGKGMDSTGVGGELNDLWKLDRTSGEWTWVSGSTVAPANSSGGPNGSAGIYDTVGSAGMPGGREQVCSWVDGSGALWIFGGEAIDVNGVTGEINDLWKFDGSQWTWMGGSNAVGAAYVFGGPGGVYGTLGSADPANVPGGRYGANCWMDAQGNFWLFGGTGIDGSGFMGTLDYLNDLWKYTPGPGGTIGAWTWMAGPSTVPTGGYDGESGVYGTLGTPDGSNYPGGRDAAMTWSDASGDIWIFGGIGIDSAGGYGYLNDLWKYTPSTGQWTWVSGSDTVPAGGPSGPTGPSGVYGTRGTAAAGNVPGGRFSAAAWVDASGNLWLMGGQGVDSAATAGYLNDLWKFDPSTAEWTWVSGSDTVPSSYAGQPGVYGTLGTPAATNVPGGRFGIPSWTDASGTLWFFGGMGNDSVAGEQGDLNDLWSFQQQ